MAETYASIMSKIQNASQPPSMQRFAVIALFDKIKASPPHLGFGSAEAVNAVKRCLRPSSSSSGCVLDEAVRQFCSLVEQNLYDAVDALNELLFSLDDAVSRDSAIVVIIKAIGYLSRLLYRRRPSPQFLELFASRDPLTHPFVRVLSSRVDVHLELLHQVVFLITDVNFGDYMELKRFLSPVFTYAMLRGLSSSAHMYFTQRLHSHLLALSCSHSTKGIWIFKILVDCIKFYPLKKSQGVRSSIGFAEELLNAFEIIASGFVAKDEIYGSFLSSLVFLALDLASRGFDSYLILCLVKKLAFLKFDSNQYGFYALELNMVVLGHMLTIVEFEHEQILLLKLLTTILKRVAQKDVCVSSKTKLEFHAQALLLFPVFHTMSSPSKAVKNCAFQLLFELEFFLEASIGMATDSSKAFERKSVWDKKHAYFLQRIMMHFYSEDQGFITWCPCLNTDYEWLTNLPCCIDKTKTWLIYLKKHLKKVSDDRNSYLSQSLHEKTVKGTILITSMIVTALILHPYHGSLALEALALIVSFEPSIGVSFLLLLLFLIDFFGRHNTKNKILMLDILRALPYLACHTSTTPLVIQTLQPMLHGEAKRELRMTALRLLCQAWEYNNRIFGHLQKYLNPKFISSVIKDEDFSLSVAASARDICRVDADSGVDIILAVQACIEHGIPAVKATGLESIAYLCELDVVDFYTAWAVISKYLDNPFSDPRISKSLCTLLRWGAMDAEAYPEASKQVVDLIWQIAFHVSSREDKLWAKPRILAIKAITFYEVSYILECIPGFREELIKLFTSEDDVVMQHAMMELIVKYLLSEHTTHRRLKKTVRVGLRKLEKLLYALPKLLFTSGRQNDVTEFLGLSLMCAGFSPPEKSSSRKEILKYYEEWGTKYDHGFLDLSESMQLSGSLCLALVSLKSWKIFMHRWLRMEVIGIEAQNKISSSEQILTMAANNILEKIMIKAEEVIPRVAEHMSLALGALCVVLPSSVHSVIMMAKSFLLDWLLQDAHEYKQWSSAISLGLVANSLHTTDCEYRQEIADHLLKLAKKTKRSLVMGACGVGLGFILQGLVSGDIVNNKAFNDIQNEKLREKEIFSHILKSLIDLISGINFSAAKSLQKLHQFEIFNTPTSSFSLSEETTKLWEHKHENLWGATGLVIGLGMSVNAIQKFGGPNMVLEVTNILISWIPFVNSWTMEYAECVQFDYDNISAVSLAVGSCLTLSTALNVCQKLELMNERLDSLLNKFRTLISEVKCKREYNYLEQNLLMATCIGAGNVLYCIVSQSLQPLKVDDVKQLMEEISTNYRDPNPPIIRFGGMIGIVDAMGAGGGQAILPRQQPIGFTRVHKQEEPAYLRESMFSEPSLELFSGLLLNEIIKASHESKSLELRILATQSLCLLRNAILDDEKPIYDRMDESQSSSRGCNFSIPLNDFPEDSVTRQLSLLLLNENMPESSSFLSPNKIAIILQCLEKQTILPSLDWGGLVKQFMRLKRNISQSEIISFSSDEVIPTVTLREASVQFIFAHAEQNSSLLIMLDELCDLTRFRLLEYELQSIILQRMTDLTRLFSQSRMEKFFLDIMEYFTEKMNCNDSDNQIVQDFDKVASLRRILWRSLENCLKLGSFSDSGVYMPLILNTIKVMFQLLPCFPLDLLNMYKTKNKTVLKGEEWSQAMECLQNAPKDWLLDNLLATVTDVAEGDTPAASVAKSILARARLVGKGFLDHLELAKTRFFLLDNITSDTWMLLVEITVALRHSSIEVKKRWLLDTIETSCITKHINMALKFLGLLAGSWSCHSSCLCINPQAVLEDLPLTLSSLFHDDEWSSIIDLVLQKLLVLINRIDNLRMKNGDAELVVTSYEELDYISDILQRTCMEFRDHLSFDFLFKIANL